MTTVVVGLDLSLTSTGVARCILGDVYTTALVKPRSTMRGHERLSFLVSTIGEHAQGADLVVVEGPSYGSAAMQRGIHERGGMWWMVTHQLWLWGIPTAVASPASVKKYATGKGGASKDVVLTSIVRRFAAFDGNNDAADALALAALGADHLGQPIVPMPQVHRDALKGVDWPEKELPL